METAKRVIRILRAVNMADKEEKIKEQKIIEELKDIADLTRIMIWGVDYSIFDEENAKCEVVAGVPFDEKEHGLGEVNQIREHEDLKYVFNMKELYIEDSPRTSKCTNYFLQTIKDKNISQIVYVPFFEEGPDKKMRGIMVVDAIGDRKFTEQEIKLFQLVGDLISVIIIEREDSIQKTRDEIYQQIVSMELGLKQYKKYGFRMIGYASSIVGALKSDPELIEDLIGKFENSGYKMMEFASVFLNAFAKIKKKIPQKNGKLNGKGK